MRWKAVQWWQEEYDRLWTGPAVIPLAPTEDAATLSCSREKVVYLSGDADQELTELKEDEVYIIGGLCDKNRYKVGDLRSCRDTLAETSRVEYMPEQSPSAVCPNSSSPHWNIYGRDDYPKNLDSQSGL